MRIAYASYGSQSGVTPNVTNALFALGHEVIRVDPTGVLALRDPRTRRPRPRRGYCSPSRPARSASVPRRCRVDGTPSTHSTSTPGKPKRCSGA